MVTIQIAQISLVDQRTFRDSLRSAIDRFTNQEATHAREHIVFDNAQLIIQILTITLEFIINDRLGPLVANDSFAGKHLHVNHGSGHARWHPQTRVFDVARFLTKDRAQELFFWRQLGFALRRDLANQRVARRYLGPDVNNSSVVQTSELRFAEIADVLGNFLRPQLRITGQHVQFFDMNRCETIVGNDLLTNQDRILKVITIPRHERDQHVLAQG